MNFALKSRLADKQLDLASLKTESARAELDRVRHATDTLIASEHFTGLDADWYVGEHSSASSKTCRSAIRN